MRWALTIPLAIATVCSVAMPSPSLAQTEADCETYLRTAENAANRPQDRKPAAESAVSCFQLRQLQGAALTKDGPNAQANADLLRSREGEAKAKDAEADANSADSFENKLGLGIGIGYSWGRGPERVDEAEVVNGVVRVKRATTDKPRLFLEAHKFIVTMGAQRRIGLGPFVSIQSGADDALSSWGAGLMFGFREEAKKGESPTSWNLGLGYLWDGDVKILGDGIVANEALPEGETEIRYKNTSAESFFVVFSRKF